jgi:hypothetical protein
MATRRGVACATCRSGAWTVVARPKHELGAYRRKRRKTIGVFGSERHDDVREDA